MSKNRITKPTHASLKISIPLYLLVFLQAQLCEPFCQSFNPITLGSPLNDFSFWCSLPTLAAHSGCFLIAPGRSGLQEALQFRWLIAEMKQTQQAQVLVVQVSDTALELPMDVFLYEILPIFWRCESPAVWRWLCRCGRTYHKTCCRRCCSKNLHRRSVLLGNFDPYELLGIPCGLLHLEQSMQLICLVSKMMSSQASQLISCETGQMAHHPVLEIVVDVLCNEILGAESVQWIPPLQNTASGHRGKFLGLREARCHNGCIQSPTRPIIEGWTWYNSTQQGVLRGRPSNFWWIHQTWVWINSNVGWKTWSALELRNTCSI